MEVINCLYLSRNQIKHILQEYSANVASREEYIPYQAWKTLRLSEEGIDVVEDEYGMLHFYEAETNKEVFVVGPTRRFYHFFYDNYFKTSENYKPPHKYREIIKEEDKYMYNFNSSTTNQWLTWNEEEKNRDVWTVTEKNSNFDSLNSFSLTLDDVNVGEALKELAGAAQATAGTIGNIGNEIKKLNDKNEKENKNMKGFNFDFGPCTNDAVKMSMYGIAVKNQAGEWVSYNPATAQIVNVDIFNFDGGKYMFKMPVSPTQVEPGDVIIHNKKAMFVLEIDENGFVVVDPHAGEEKKVVPTSNCFGFNFVTKVVSMFDAFVAAPTTDAPFGNFLPFVMMGEDKEIDPMMMMFMMNQNGNMNDMFSNPMMMYMLCGDKMKGDSVWPLMFLMNQNKEHKCKCGK